MSHRNDACYLGIIRQNQIDDRCQQERNRQDWIKDNRQTKNHGFVDTTDAWDDGNFAQRLQMNQLAAQHQDNQAQCSTGTAQNRDSEHLQVHGNRSFLTAGNQFTVDTGICDSD